MGGFRSFSTVVFVSALVDAVLVHTLGILVATVFGVFVTLTTFVIPIVTIAAVRCRFRPGTTRHKDGAKKPGSRE